MKSPWIRVTDSFGVNAGEPIEIGVGWIVGVIGPVDSCVSRIGWLNPTEFETYQYKWLEAEVTSEDLESHTESLPL